MSRAIACHTQPAENWRFSGWSASHPVFTDDPPCSEPNSFTFILGVSPADFYREPHPSVESKHQMHRLRTLSLPQRRISRTPTFGTLKTPAPAIGSC
jgi:hypothetical protein